MFGKMDLIPRSIKGIIDDKVLEMSNIGVFLRSQ